MVRINSPILNGTHAGVARPGPSMEQQMLMKTLREKKRPMSAFELTNHWMPTWTLQEVNKHLHELAQSGYVRAHGREAKLFSIVDQQTESRIGRVMYD